jgi:hypothetical protein
MRKSIFTQSDLDEVKMEVENELQDPSVTIDSYNGYPTITFEYMKGKYMTIGSAKALGIVLNIDAIRLFSDFVDNMKNNKIYKKAV